jgi:hypothetical protein
MQTSVKQYAREVQRTRDVPNHIRVGLNNGEVVVRSIGSDLHMDYTAVGQTTHLAARMEQTAVPGSILITAEVLCLVEGYIQVDPLGALPIKGPPAPAEVYEVTGAGPVPSRLQATAARGLTRFVGSDTELDQLRQGLAVIGEPGAGKSCAPMSSRTSITLTAGSSWRAALCPTARPPSISQSLTCSPWIEP